MDFKLVNPDRLPPGAPQIPKDEPKMDVNAIPDLEKLLDAILEFVRYINTEEMQELEIKDQLAFERHLDSKFENLSLRHYSIFRLLLDKENREENLCKLIDVFKELKKVKMGVLDIHEATKQFHEEKNSEYIYPKFGGKEQFEQAMLKAAKKKDKNKRKGNK